MQNNAAGSRHRNRMVIRSVDFFNPELKKPLVYESEEKDSQLAPPNEATLLNGFKSSKIIATNYQRAPKMTGPGHIMLEAGEYVIPIKCIGQREGGDLANPGGPKFSFVYSGYDKLLKEHRRTLTEYCSYMDEAGVGRVNNMFEVPVGGLFGLKVDDIYARVRIVELNFETNVLTYWAVDEGVFGTCTCTELIYLSDDCLILSMLVIPGVFEKDPRPSQLTKFEEKMYALAVVKQPTLSCDHGPRKITLY